MPRRGVAGTSAVPRARAARVRKVLAVLRARVLTRLARRDEPLSCLEDERLDLVAPHFEDLGDLVVCMRAELGEQQRRPLVVGQPREIAEQLPQVLALLD